MPTEAKEPAPPPIFDFHLDDRGVHLAPRSWDELEQWLDVEREYWKWLPTAPADTNGNGIYHNNFQHYEPQIRSFIERAKSMPADENVQRESANNIRAYLEQRFANKRAIHSSTPVAEYLTRLSKSDLIAAVYAVWVLMGNTDKNADNLNAHRGYTAANLFLLGFNQTPPDYTSAWKKLHKSVANQQDTLRAEDARISENYAQQLTADRNAQSQQTEAHETGMNERSIEWVALKGVHTKEMDAIRKAFREDTALKAAVTYFQTKSREQKVVAAVARNWGIGIAIAVVVITLVIGFLVLSERVTPNHATLGVCLVFAFLFFWLLRIVVRVFLSATHLSTDLDARSTFVQTYLALIAEGGAIAEKQRDQVIGLVFRPISDGLVKDDAAPPSWMTLLQGK